MWVSLASITYFRRIWSSDDTTCTYTRGLTVGCSSSTFKVTVSLVPSVFSSSRGKIAGSKLNFEFKLCYRISTDLFKSSTNQIDCPDFPSNAFQHSGIHSSSLFPNGRAFVELSAALEGSRLFRLWQCQSEELSFYSAFQQGR